MQINHLPLMGIQCWESRPEINAISDGIKFVKTNEESSSDKQITQGQEISVYAAISQRQTQTGELQNWLWVVPHSSLATQHIRLLDKIVNATGSQWESVSIADNYVNQRELDHFLQQPLSAIVIMGKMMHWQGFYQSQIYQSKRFIMGIELADLFNSPELKREIRQSLQNLMENV